MVLAIQWGTVVATAAVTTVVGDKVREAREKAKAESDDSDGSGGGTEAMNDDKLDELVQIQRTNNAPPESVDAFVGETVTIPDGGMATVEVTPTQGNNLRVDRVYWDRRSSTSYEHVVGGIQVSTAHEADFTRPRKISQGGKAVGIAENNSGSDIEIDYELAGWAIPTGVSRGAH